MSPMAASDQGDFEFEVLVKAGKKAGWEGRPCPMCGTKSFQYQGVYGMPKFAQDEKGALNPIPSKVMPVAVLLCAKCSYVVTFAWIVLQKSVTDV